MFLRFSFKFRARDDFTVGENRVGLKRVALYSLNFPTTLTEMDFLCLSHGRSKKCREVISAKRYWYQRTADDEGEDRLVHEGGGGRHSTSPLSNKDYNTAWPCSLYAT